LTVTMLKSSEKRWEIKGEMLTRGNQEARRRASSDRLTTCNHHAREAETKAGTPNKVVICEHFSVFLTAPIRSCTPA
jgi:hypothetical protein